MNNITTQIGIKDRLLSLFDQLMTDTDIIPAAFKKVANNLVRSYLEKADPASLRGVVENIRDQVIPWLLNDDPNQ